jgi:integrase
VDRRQQEGAANATVNREMAALKRMFHLGYKATPRKVAQIPSFPHLREDNVRQGFLEDEAYRKLIDGAELWFRALVECARTYAWRHQELISLQVKQIDLAQRVIRLEPGTTKNGDGREVLMTETLFHLLSALSAGKGPDDPVFTRPDGSPVRDFRHTWTKACAAAVCPICCSTICSALEHATCAAPVSRSPSP